MEGSRAVSHVKRELGGQGRRELDGNAGAVTALPGPRASRGGPLTTVFGSVRGPVRARLAFRSPDGRRPLTACSGPQPPPCPGAGDDGEARHHALLYGKVALALDEGGDSHDFDVWRGLPLRENDDAIPIVGGSLRVLPCVVHLFEARPDASRGDGPADAAGTSAFRDAQPRLAPSGKRPPLRELNIDHVLPRSCGAETTPVATW